MPRNILHCDMNNFYASVECMLDPALKKYPVAVCGSVAVSNLIQRNNAICYSLTMHPHTCAKMHHPHNDTVFIVVGYMRES